MIIANCTPCADSPTPLKRRLPCSPWIDASCSLTNSAKSEEALTGRSEELPLHDDEGGAREWQQVDEQEDRQLLAERIAGLGDPDPHVHRRDHEPEGGESDEAHAHAVPEATRHRLAGGQAYGQQHETAQDE